MSDTGKVKFGSLEELREAFKRASEKNNKASNKERISEAKTLKPQFLKSEDSQSSDTSSKVDQEKTTAQQPISPLYLKYLLETRKADPDKPPEAQAIDLNAEFEALRTRNPKLYYTILKQINSDGDNRDAS